MFFVHYISERGETMLLLCLSSAEKRTQPTIEPRYLDDCIQRMSNGDKEALADLYQAASAAVYAFSLSVLKNTHDAEDVLHDCFVQVYGAASSYTENGKPMAWIFTIAKNLCFAKLRVQKRYADEETCNWQEALQQNETLQSEDRMMLSACMRHLSDEERNILVLHAVAGFKHREIADMLSLPLSTVLSKYRRSLKKLKNLIAKGEILS